MTAAVVHIPHKHAADQSKIEATKVRADLLQRAATSNDRPRQLRPIAQVAHHSSVDVVLKLGKKETLHKAINRERRVTLPKEPTTLAVCCTLLFSSYWLRSVANDYRSFFPIYYGRPLSVSGRPCYILPMFFLFIYFF